MPNQVTPLDRVFHALADQTRRAVLERLSGGPAPVSRLAQSFDMALPSFSQHLKVLESCGLVRSRKSGRMRIYRLAPKRLEVAEHWIVKQRLLWARRLKQLDHYLIRLEEKR